MVTEAHGSEWKGRRMLGSEGDNRHGRGLEWSSVPLPQVLDLEYVLAVGPQWLFSTLMVPPPTLCVLLLRPHEWQNNIALFC